MRSLRCAACGQEVPDGARFCPNCGASQTVAEEERRLVTVVFADIVGFTRRSESMDPEEVKHLVDRTFDRLAADITSFGGVVDKVVGDQIIALFGAPVAHEDDAERAVRAALRMQQTLLTTTAEAGQAVEMRVGVNTGEVLVGSTSAGGDYTAMGDTMNLASRLEELASPGQVIVGSTTYSATNDAISYRAIGALTARGRTGAVEAYQALSPIRAPGARTRRGTRFVGREHELALLMAQGRLAADQGRSQSAVISGEAGIGKTRVVQETAARMASRYGARVIEGRCIPYGEANVWWPIAEMFRHVLDLSADMTLEEVQPVLVTSAAFALDLDPASLTDPARWPPEVLRLVTTLSHILGYDTSMRGGDRDRNRSEVIYAVTTMIAKELAVRPVVLVLSDMDWASEAVWMLVNTILTDFSDSALVVLLTARTADVAQRLLSASHGALHVQLGPMDSDASSELLDQLGVELPIETSHLLVDRSGGNPFFLEELAGLVASQAANEGPAMVAQLVSGSLDRLPDTLRGTVAARLDGLSPSQRALLQDAAVLGRVGSLQGLMVLAQEVRNVDDISADIEALVEADLLFVDSREYRFRSDLVRDVAYGTITKTLRAQRHHGIAEYLEGMHTIGRIRNSVAANIADHYRAAAVLSSELVEVPGLDQADVRAKALSWLAEAGKRALDSDPPSAEAWHTAGLALSQDDTSRAEFLYGRAKARCEVRDLVGSRLDLDALDALSEHDPLLRAQSLLVRGDVERKAGNVDMAASLLREASDRLAIMGSASDQSLALRLLGLTELARSDEELARQALVASRRVAEEAGDIRSQAWALQSIAWLAFQSGRVGEARVLIATAVETFTDINDSGGLAWARGVQAWVAFHTGQFEASRELVDEVLPETSRRGDPWAEAVMYVLDASLLLWTGKAKRAVEAARTAFAKAGAADEVNLAVQASAVEGRALVSLGSISFGTQRLEEAFALADRSNQHEARRIAAVACCSSAARLGDSERSIRWAARFEGAHGDLDVVGESDLVVSLALAMLQRGALDEAATELGWVDSPEPESNELFGHAVGAMIAAARDRHEEALQRVDVVLAGDATYLDRVLALQARAAAYVRMGDQDGCEQALEDARQELVGTDDRLTGLFIELLAGLCGAGDLEDAESNLRTAGVDPTGWRTAWTLVTGKAFQES